MSTTILEALQNADYNIQNNDRFGLVFAKEQLHNAVSLLDKGYDLEDEMDEILENYPNIQDVPEKDLP
jgi:hypothetical protein